MISEMVASFTSGIERFLPLSDRGPPSPTSPRGAFMPGTFRVLVFGM
jgi:hypothetical protein